MESQAVIKDELKEEKIWRLIIKYSVPAILAMMITSLYNTVDRAFIGSMNHVRCKFRISFCSYDTVHCKSW